MLVPRFWTSAQSFIALLKSTMMGLSSVTLGVFDVVRFLRDVAILPC